MSEKTKTYLLTIYNGFIIALAIVSIVLVVLELCEKINLSSGLFFIIDSSILIIFFADYIIRFIRSSDKKIFFKKNICDLIAIIPFNNIFVFFRFARIFRLVKFTKILKVTKLAALFGRFSTRANKFLHTNGFIYMLYSSGVLIFISSLIMMFAENKSFTDALWWSIVTVTTVGYGDISPETGIGRIIAVILMLFGIGLVSMLTGTITSYFTNINNESKKPIVHIDGMELTEEQQNKIIDYVKTLK